MVAEGPVRQAVVVEEPAVVAEVGLAACAEAALAADREERTDHVVTDREPGDAVADLLDNARALVPADDRVPDRDVAGTQVVVGVAQPRGGELDEDLAGLRPVQVEFHDLEVLANVPEHRCSCLHQDLPGVETICQPSSA